MVILKIKALPLSKLCLKLEGTLTSQPAFPEQESEKIMNRGKTW